MNFRDDGKQFLVRLNYNWLKNQKKKKIYFEGLCKLILKKLRSVWNPNIKEKQKDKSELKVAEEFDIALKIKEDSL